MWEQLLLAIKCQNNLCLSVGNDSRSMQAFGPFGMSVECSDWIECIQHCTTQEHWPRCYCLGGSVSLHISFLYGVCLWHLLLQAKRYSIFKYVLFQFKYFGHHNYWLIFWLSSSEKHPSCFFIGLGFTESLSVVIIGHWSRDQKLQKEHFNFCNDAAVAKSTSQRPNGDWRQG